MLNSVLIELLEDSFLLKEYLTYIHRIDEAESNLSRLEFNLLSIPNNDDDMLDLGSISSGTSSYIIVEEFVDYDLDDTAYILSTYSLSLSQQTLIPSQPCPLPTTKPRGIFFAYSEQSPSLPRVSQLEN